MSKFVHDPVIIAFTDLKKAFFHHIFALRIMVVFSFLGMFVFLLIREPQFLAGVSVQRIAKITDYYIKLPEVYRAFVNYPIETDVALEMGLDQVLKPVVENLGLQMVINKNFWNRCLENAKENILAACGHLPQLFPSDLKTLRQICTFIESHKIPDRSLIVALITEQYPDYTPSLASLLALRF